MFPLFQTADRKTVALPEPALCTGFAIFGPVKPMVPDEEIRHFQLQIDDPTAAVILSGTLRVPPAPLAWVIFAHGSGSSRFSPRNLQVARALNQAHFATLLFDLLTPEESSDRRAVFDIPRLKHRLILAVKTLRQSPEFNLKPIVLFGASTGAAAALEAAADLGRGISFVVARGGRVDLASPAASKVSARVLLIVGALDEPVLEWNRQVLKLLPRGELRVIPGAGHLFEEPRALEAVANETSRFLTNHLKAGGSKLTLHP